MFVKVGEGMMELLFEKYGESNFPGLDEEDYGYFYWDDWDEKFHYLDKNVIKRVQRFIDGHEMASGL